MHSWSPKFRVTPVGGNAYEVSVAAYDAMTVCRPRPVPLPLEQETINLDIITTRRAVRLFVDMVFEFDTPSANEAELVTMVLNPHFEDDAVVELSLDNGTIYREVVLSDEGPKPEAAIEGKNIGTLYSMTWVCVEVLPRFIVLGGGGWA